MTKEYSSYLAHHGILGQKWGVRRYQNEDGSLTEEGRKRYIADGVSASNLYRRALENAKEIERMAKTGSLETKNPDIKAASDEYRRMGASDNQIRAYLSMTLSQMETNGTREANKASIEYEKRMSDFVKSQQRVTLKDIEKYSTQIAKEVAKEEGASVADEHFLVNYQRNRWKKIMES